MAINLEEKMSGSPSVRITKISAIIVNAEMRNWIFVRVDTNQPGLYGWGEATLNWKTRTVVSLIQDLEPMLIGRDPLNIEECVRALKRYSYYRLGIIGATAISGIEHALWDILGKSAGLPVWRLLGGKLRDRVEIYTHLGLGDMKSVYETEEPRRLAELGRSVVEQGYRALKAVIVPYCGYSADIEDLRKTDKMMASLRDAVGDDIKIMIDFHGRPGSCAAAIDYIRVLEPYNPMFCEEPIQPGNAAGFKWIKDGTKCAIATGERLIELDEFAELISSGGVDIVQPDLCHCGGIRQAKRIAELAERYDVGVAPHNPNGPIASVVALHFVLSIPNFVIQEEMSGAVPWYDEVVTSPLTAQHGKYWTVPTAPGLGVEVDESAAAKHPYREELIHSMSAVLRDGTIANW